jgi:tripartite ATP-independent transporter DctP family solute receptor
MFALCAFLAAGVVSCSKKADGAAAPAAAAKAAKTPMRIVHPASETFHMAVAIQKWADEMNATGMFDVQVFPNGIFGSDLEGLEGTKSGDVDATVTPSSYFTEEVPAIAMIELPYVFAGGMNARKVLAGPWGKEILGRFDAIGLHAIGHMPYGMRNITNSRREITSPADVRGLKLRTMPVPAHIFFWNSLGASAEGSPFQELYTNLSNKVFDGQENPIGHVYSSKFYEVQSFMSFTEHVCSSYVVAFNKKYWDSLRPEQVAFMEESFVRCKIYDESLMDAEEAKQLEEIETNKNFPTKVTHLTPAQIAAFMDAAKPTHEKYTESLKDEYTKFTAAVKAAL